MSKIRQALRLFTQGKSKMFIQEHTGLSRNTVKKHINLFIESKQSFEEVNNLTDKDLDELFGNNPKLEPSEKLK
jgi:response regulator of citrate/malate metabolism